jgi:UDPglucose--hexose-1-phosphate uridylyltransferase
MNLSAYHVRRDRLTNQWVACAPDRGERPKRTQITNPDAKRGRVAGCPFCTGNEHMLPDILAETTAEDGTWRVRAVPNKYPAFHANTAAAAQTNHIYEGRSAHGHQEVIIDTPHHHHGWALLEAEQIARVLAMYQRRYGALNEAHPDLYPVLFRNHGGRAGASLEHPHSQLIAPPLPPTEMQAEEQRCRTFYEEEGVPLMATVRTRELDAEDRLVATNKHMVAFVPYAAPAPYSVWVVPRRNAPRFTDMTDAERHACAELSRTVARRYATCANDPDYNMTMHTALDADAEAPHVVWSLRFAPRVSVRAGFELGTNMLINPSLPEVDAKVLRGV